MDRYSLYRKRYYIYLSLCSLLLLYRGYLYTESSLDFTYLPLQLGRATREKETCLVGSDTFATSSSLFRDRFDSLSNNEWLLRGRRADWRVACVDKRSSACVQESRRLTGEAVIDWTDWIGFSEPSVTTSTSLLVTTSCTPFLAWKNQPTKKGPSLIRLTALPWQAWKILLPYLTSVNVLMYPSPWLYPSCPLPLAKRDSSGALNFKANDSIHHQK